jgi:hypothetical protein
MEHLPPVGWAAAATKRDIDKLGEVNRREHEALEKRLLAQFRSELMAQTRTFVVSLIGAFLTSTAVAVALARAL